MALGRDGWLKKGNLKRRENESLRRFTVELRTKKGVIKKWPQLSLKMIS